VLSLVVQGCFLHELPTLFSIEKAKEILQEELASRSSTKEFQDASRKRQALLEQQKEIEIALQKCELVLHECSDALPAQSSLN
jgi:hypothetical protein